MVPTLQSHHQQSSRRSRPVRSSRTQVQSYHEDSASEDRLDEDTESDEEGSRRLSLSLRPRDSNRMPVSYREESSDSDLDEDPVEDPSVVLPMELSSRRTYPFPEPATNTTPTRATRSRTIKTRSQAKRSAKPSRKKRIELGRPRNKRQKVEEDHSIFVGSGIIPPWQTLPYHILFDIFLRASYPLIDGKAGKRNPSVEWLVKVALLCRSFCEPALAALYYSPPLDPPAKSHGLLSLLSRPEDAISSSYVNKIKELHVDVETLLSHKSGPALGYFDLSKLIEKTPQVKVLRLYHNDDYVIGLPLWQIPRSKWVYPESLFSSIGSNSIHLRSWDWNSRFMETKRLLPLMLAQNRQSSFNGIQELRLLHLAAEDSDHDEVTDMANGREAVLASALNELPNLHHLEFLECSILNEKLLPNLPLNLTCLTINNCDDVSTINFGPFLSSHGHFLRELNISHNRHLSLSFIVGLKESCERLEKFKMDISMHDYSSYHDVEPHFFELLSSSDIPTWPTTLQDLELIQLRKWDDVTAEVFFTSLIEAAQDLRNLRRLVISAILKIGWRDRASFREKWIGKMERVFLRRSPPPDPNRRCIPHPPEDPSRSRSTPAAEEAITHSDAPNSGFSTPSKRKSARIAEMKLSEADENDIHSPSSRRSQGTDNDHIESIHVIQGMCDVVTVRIDNQRPTDTQFNEQDFLDDELSGDEDWNGNDDLGIGDAGHAW